MLSKVKTILTNSKTQNKLFFRMFTTTGTSRSIKSNFKPVKVISIKKVTDLYHVKGIDSYTESLTDIANCTQGYIRSSYYWKYPELTLDPNEETEYILVTESEWDDIGFWNDWLQSSQRQKIQDEYNEYFSNIEHIVMEKKPEVMLPTM